MFFVIAALAVVYSQTASFSYAQSPADDLQPIILAYNNADQWMTYRANSTENMQTALILQTDTAPIYQLIHQWASNLQAAYHTSLRAMQATWTKTDSLQEFSGTTMLQGRDILTDFGIIGVDGRLYVVGTRDFSPDLANRSRAYSVYTWLSSEVAPQDLKQVGDYNTYRSIPEVLNVIGSGRLGSTEVIKDVRFGEREVVAYTVTLDTPSAVVAFRLDIDYLFQFNSVRDVVKRDRFYDALPTNSIFQLTVYLDRNSGELIGEDITFTISARLTSMDLFNPPQAGIFHMEMLYLREITYSGVNFPLQIQAPLPDS